MFNKYHIKKHKISHLPHLSHIMYSIWLWSHKRQSKMLLLHNKKKVVHMSLNRSPGKENFFNYACLCKASDPKSSDTTDCRVFNVSWDPKSDTPDPDVFIWASLNLCIRMKNPWHLYVYFNGEGPIAPFWISFQQI